MAEHRQKQLVDSCQKVAETLECARHRSMPIVNVCDEDRGAFDVCVGASRRMAELDFEFCDKFPMHIQKLAFSVMSELAFSFWDADDVGVAKYLIPGTNDWLGLECAELMPSFHNLNKSPVFVDLSTVNTRFRRKNPVFVGGLHPNLDTSLPVIDLGFNTTKLLLVDAIVYSKQIRPNCWSRISGFFDPNYLSDPGLPSGWLYSNPSDASSVRRHEFVSLVMAKFFEDLDGQYVGQTYSLTFDVETGCLASFLVDYADLYWHYFTSGFISVIEKLDSVLVR